jgi:hypothetical protein
MLLVVLIGFSLVGLAFNLLFSKNGKFPDYHVGHNKDMAKLGITCVKHDEVKCFNKLKAQAGEGCGSCGG